MFPKIGVFPPNHPLKIGFSIIFTIHFGGNTPIFGNTQISGPLRSCGSLWIGLELPPKIASQEVLQAKLRASRAEAHTEAGFNGEFSIDFLSSIHLFFRCFDFISVFLVA